MPLTKPCSKHRKRPWLARRLIVCLVPLLSWTAGCAPAAPLVDRDQVPQGDRRLLVISVDGMRPDVLLRAEAPAIRGLMRRGSFTFYAESTDLAITLPTHASMLTGLQPKVHGILINSDTGKGAAQVLTKPTLLTLAKQAGRTTAMVAGKSKFSIFDKPGALDWSCYPKNQPGPDHKPVKSFTDAQVGQGALDIMRKDRPAVMFVHFPGPDYFGHRDGWGGETQLAAIGQIDGWIGKLLAELDRQGVAGRTLILLTADHGGAVKNHGGIDPRSRYIPFIAAGPGVRQNYDLTLQRGLVVHVEDTFATGLEWLGIARPEGVYGKPVWAIYQTPPKSEPKTAPATMPAAVPAM